MPIQEIEQLEIEDLGMVRHQVKKGSWTDCLVISLGSVFSGLG